MLRYPRIASVGVSCIEETSNNSGRGNQVYTEQGSAPLYLVCANPAVCCIQKKKDKQIHHAYLVDRLQLLDSLAKIHLETAQQAENFIRKTLRLHYFEWYSTYIWLVARKDATQNSFSEHELPLQRQQFTTATHFCSGISDRDREIGGRPEGRKNNAAQQRNASATVSLRQLWCPRISVKFVRFFM